MIGSLVSSMSKSTPHGCFLYLYFYFWLSSLELTSARECDARSCKGPIMFYKDLNCKPTFDGTDSCCAVGYDCSNLRKRSPSKCFVNENEYDIGDRLRDEDRTSPCNIDCTCRNLDTDIAEFECAEVDCLDMNVRRGCYWKPEENSCCDGKEVCPTEANAVTCKLDGIVYNDGQKFYPKEDPDLICTCREGYTGVNDERFCELKKCGTELKFSAQLHKTCAPVYDNGQSVQASCPFSYRCQNVDDEVISRAKLLHGADTPRTSDEITCKLGSLVMQVGDELNQGTDYSSSCVKCVCEVPPTPTCQQLPAMKCNRNNNTLSRSKS